MKWEDDCRNIIKSGAVRKYDRRTLEFVKACGFKEGAYYRRMKEPGTFSLSEFRRVVIVTGMQDEDILRIVKGGAK